MSPLFRSTYAHSESLTEPQVTQHVIDSLRLQRHPEGGYFAETDRDQRQVPNPFEGHDVKDLTRCASTTIYYFLTPSSPKGSFHRNKGRTVHTLHKGRGRYTIIHADEPNVDGKAPIETFVVGHDINAGERLQWVVDGGKYKASCLLEDVDGGDGSDGLLISETVIPGFEFTDHNFLQADDLAKLVSQRQKEDLQWLLLECA